MNLSAVGSKNCNYYFSLFFFRQFVFVIVFSTFLSKCVNYDILFDNVSYTSTGIVNNQTLTVTLNETSHKVSLHEAIIPSGQCLQS